jgi:hypothetical protein
MVWDLGYVVPPIKRLPGRSSYRKYKESNIDKTAGFKSELYTLGWRYGRQSYAGSTPVRADSSIYLLWIPIQCQTNSYLGSSSSRVHNVQNLLTATPGDGLLVQIYQGFDNRVGAKMYTGVKFHCIYIHLRRETG